MVRFGVACSTNWDPEVAAVEATTKALEQVVEKPKFLLIFCTIHYAKEKGGLKKLLYGCRSLVDEDIPSIGGTVTGFICPEGCHTRGVVVVAGGGDDIDITSCHVGDIRIAPNLSGRTIAQIINKQLNSSKKRVKLIFEVSEGAREPKILTYTIVRSIIGKLPSRLLHVFIDVSLEFVRYFKQGLSMTEDLLDAMDTLLEKYYIVGISTFDNLRGLNHYQFYNERVLQGSCVVIGLALDSSLTLNRSLPIVSTGKRFKITRGKNKYGIYRIENKQAVEGYIEKMGWPTEYVKEHIEEIGKKTFYYPLGFRKENQIYAFPAGFFFGGIIGTNKKIEKDELELFLTSAGGVINDLRSHMRPFVDKKKNFVLVLQSSPIIGVLGEKINIVKGVMDTHVSDLPYLVLYGAGEHFKKPSEKLLFSDFTTTILSISDLD